MAVRMTHPETGGEYDAQPQQVPHLERAGWKVAPGQDEQGEAWPAELQRFEGQDQVRLRHPVTGGESVVAASAVPYWRERGWQVVEEPEVEAQAGLEDKTLEQLRDEARARGLPISGTKAELRERLAEQATQDQAEETPAEPASEESEE